MTLTYAIQLLEMSAACFEVQAETARQYARAGINTTSNTALAAELQHKAQVIREALRS